MWCAKIINLSEINDKYHVFLLFISDNFLIKLIK